MVIQNEAVIKKMKQKTDMTKLLQCEAKGVRYYKV